jgi:hypothetical protein
LYVEQSRPRRAIRSVWTKTFPPCLPIPYYWMKWLPCFDLAELFGIQKILRLIHFLIGRLDWRAGIY